MRSQQQRGKAGRAAASCTECQRRKQKCSREWPCNHCQARRIPHLCHFGSKKPVRTFNKASGRTSHKQSNEGIKQHTPVSPDISVSPSEDRIRALGYLPSSGTLHEQSPGTESSYGIPNEVQYTSSSEMEGALRAIPPKPYSDILVQSFLNEINYSYYSIYPPAFSEEYSLWWADRASGKKLKPEFTCLLLRVCACSAQNLRASTRQKLEFEMGERRQVLSERFDRASRLLSHSIPPGKGGLAQVQQLFLAATWFKGEILFVESWHTLASAIHEAQELDMHKDSDKGGITEFDREMRRRVWCLLYMWDWQMSMLLSRPLIISQSCCTLKLPNLHFEGLDTPPDLPSPMAHVVLQCQLCQTLSKVPGTTDGTLSPAQIPTIQQETQKWFDSLPPPFKLSNPDSRWDKDHWYVGQQRCLLHAVGYMTLLQTLKPYLARSTDSGVSESERNLQPTAVSYSLALMDAARRLFDYIFPIDAKFHLVIFLVFDTSTALCSAIFHDVNCSLPQRTKVVECIGTGLYMMEKLNDITKTGSICYPILTRLVARLTLSPQERLAINSAWHLKGANSESPVSELQQNQDGVPSTSDSSANGLVDHEPLQIETNETVMPPSLDLHFSSVDTSTGNDLPFMDIGELNQIWDWDALRLDLSFPVNT